MRGAGMQANLRLGKPRFHGGVRSPQNWIPARLPVDYKVWKWLHLFECGKMEDAGYAYGVFKRHFDTARSRRAFNKFARPGTGPRRFARFQR